MEKKVESRTEKSSEKESDEISAAEMKITLADSAPASVETGALVTYVFEAASALESEDQQGTAAGKSNGSGVSSGPVEGVVAELDRLGSGKQPGAKSGVLAGLAESGELTGKMLEMTLVHAPVGLAAQRLLLVGAGKAKNSALPNCAASPLLRFVT